MNGGDLGAIAQNVLVYFGGQAGGLLVGAAMIVMGLLASWHVVSGRTWVHSAAFGVGAWISAFVVRQFIGWG